jgi:hypothetical protein
MRVATPPASVTRSMPAATPGRTGSYCQKASCWPEATSREKVEGKNARTSSASPSTAVIESPMRGRWRAGRPRPGRWPDLVTVVAERVCGPLCARLGLRTRPLPFDLPPVPVIVAWHHRYDTDPAHAWLRGQVAGALRGILGVDRNSKES